MTVVTINVHLEADTPILVRDLSTVGSECVIAEIGSDNDVRLYGPPDVVRAHLLYAIEQIDEIIVARCHGPRQGFELVSAWGTEVGE